MGECASGTVELSQCQQEREREREKKLNACGGGAAGGGGGVGGGSHAQFRPERRCRQPRRANGQRAEC